MRSQRTRFVLLSLLIFMGWACAGCSSLLYYPTRYLYVDMAQVQPQPEDWVFKSSDGTELNGWYFKSKTPPKGVVILFHGNGQNRSAHFTSVFWMVDEGYDLFVFDYPGYGKSPGKPTPESTVMAGVAALKTLKERKPNLPIIVYAHSLGGAIGARSVYEVRNEVHPKILFLSSTFESYRGVGRRVMANHWVTWLFQPVGWLVLNDEWAPKGHLDELNLPVVVIHAKKDEVIPYDLGEKLYSDLKEPKEFWPINDGPDRPHNQLLELPHGLEIRHKIIKKLDEVLKPAAAEKKTAK